MIDVDELRRGARRRAAERARPHFDGRITDGRVDGVTTRSYAPRDSASEQTAFFCHGGYGLFGDLDLQDAYCRRLATALRCPVVAVDYRLAPEHSFDDAVSDLERCVLAITPGGPAVLCGDSAGGAVSVAAAQRLGARVRALLLTNPNLDLTLASFDREAPEGPDWATSVFALTAWARPRALSDAPRLHQVEGPLPPVFIAVGERDALVNEARTLAATCEVRDAPWELHVLEGRGHGFISDAPLADRVLRSAALFVGRH